MPLLRRAHGHHRGVRALESAPRTAAWAGRNRKERSVTRHGLAPPRASRASGVAATRVIALHRRPVRLQRRPTTPNERLDTGRTQPVRIGAGLCQRWSRRPQDQPKIEIPIDHRPDPAGSFLGDFRTPAGARNSSRKQHGGFGAEAVESCPVNIATSPALVEWVRLSRLKPHLC